MSRRLLGGSWTRLDGVIADAKNEGSDPAENLRMAVRLDPGRGHCARGPVIADLDEIPDPENCSRQQHEKQPGADVGHQYARQLNFASGEGRGARIQRLRRSGFN